MKLLIDAGNTRLKWALCDERGHLSAHGVTEYDRSQVPDQAAVLWLAMQDVTGVWLASVVTNFEQALYKWCDEHLPCPVYSVASEAAEHGLKNAYAEPQSLGIDRWLSLLAARHLNQSEVVMVADCGSALTLDVIEGDQHLGGLIVPGVDMMRCSLGQGADRLPAAQQTGNVGAISSLGLAGTTLGCIDQGAVAANVAVIDRLAGRLSAAHQGQFELMVCGGSALLLLPLLDSAYHHVEDLVLQGLAIKAGGGA